MLPLNIITGTCQVLQRFYLRFDFVVVMLEVDTDGVVHLLETVHVFVNLRIMVSTVYMINRPFEALQLLHLLGQFHISGIMINIENWVLQS